MYKVEIKVSDMTSDLAKRQFQFDDLFEIDNKDWENVIHEVVSQVMDNEENPCVLCNGKGEIEDVTFKSSVDGNPVPIHTGNFSPCPECKL